MSRSSGQRVSIRNCTRFTLHKVKVEEVCGESQSHPTEIPPTPEVQEGKGIWCLQNNGNRDYYGSEIQYTYRFVDTPDQADYEWLLKIWSIGAYQLRNACFAAQIVRKNRKEFVSDTPWLHDLMRKRRLVGVTMAQISWRDTTKHHDDNPNPNNDGVKPECPFEIQIPDVSEFYPGQGISHNSAYYDVKLRIGMKPGAFETYDDGQSKGAAYAKVADKRETIIKFLSVNTDPNRLASSLETKGLINDDIKAKAYVEARTHPERIRPMIEAVISRIELNVKNYEKFISVLREEGGLEELIDVLQL